MAYTNYQMASEALIMDITSIFMFHLLRTSGHFVKLNFPSQMTQDYLPLYTAFK